jgi:hypothetical protein
MNTEFIKLIHAKEEDRNEDWVSTFIDAIQEQKVQLLSEEPQYGPDNWPYLLVKTNTDDETESGLEAFNNVAKWCADEGIGLVVNPEKDLPDFVFTYGMLWNFVHTGKFLFKPEEIDSQMKNNDDAQSLLVGEPSHDFLPEDVRVILREFFSQQGVECLKILMLRFPNEEYFELGISLESLQNPPEEEYENILEAISWFFPRHFRLSLVSESEVGQPFYNL